MFGRWKCSPSNISALIFLLIGLLVLLYSMQKVLLTGLPRCWMTASNIRAPKCATGSQKNIPISPEIMGGVAYGTKIGTVAKFVTR